MNIRRDKKNDCRFCEVGVSSIIGSRSYQQDYAYTYEDTNEVMAVVCDGMGGLSGGERASETAVAQLAYDFAANHDMAAGNMHEFFSKVAHRMNAAVYGLVNEKGERLHAGTTFVGVYINQGIMYWVSVGDSRIWMIKGEQIKAVNRDHNYRLMLKERLDSGIIDRATFEAEEKTPKAEALISYLGIEELRLVDTGRVPIRLEQGDIVVITSDGVYKSLTDAQVLAMVRDNDIDMGIASDRMVNMALRYGMNTQDNTTAIVVRYNGN